MSEQPQLGDLLARIKRVEERARLLHVGENADKLDGLHATSFVRRYSVAQAIEPWREVSADPGFNNSWVNYGGVYATVAYYKDPLGIVHLRGLIKDGTAGWTIFILPVGYRPAAEEIFPAYNNTVVTDLRITSAGYVNPNGGNNVWLSLSGITFRAA